MTILKAKREIFVRGFDLTLSQVINLGTSSDVFVVRVEDRVRLKLTHFGNYVADISAWGNVQWDLLINKGFDQSLNGIKDQIGTQNIPRELGWQPIYNGGSVVEIRLTNNSGTINYAMGVTFKGYFFYDA